MSTLQENYKQITNPDGWYLPKDPSIPVTGNSTHVVSPKFNFWTVAIDGAAANYTITVRGVGMPTFRAVEDGVIVGGAAGFVANFEGSVEAIQIIPPDGAAYTYSITGKVQS